MFSSDLCPFHSFRWPMLAAAGEKSFGRLVPNEGLSEDRRDLMRSRAAVRNLHPAAAAKKRRGILAKMLSTNSFPLAQVKELIASEYPWFRELAGPEWRFLELLTGHWPMFSRPDDLAELLIDILPSEASDIE